MDDIDTRARRIEPIEQPRVLFVSDEVAWPPTSGYRQRTAQCLRALAAVGSVDWLAAPRVAPPDPAGIAPPGINCERVAIAVAGTRFARLCVASVGSARPSLATRRRRLARRRSVARRMAGDHLRPDLGDGHRPVAGCSTGRIGRRRPGDRHGHREREAPAPLDGAAVERVGRASCRAPMARLDLRRWRLLEARGRGGRGGRLCLQRRRSRPHRRNHVGGSQRRDRSRSGRTQRSRGGDAVRGFAELRAQCRRRHSLRHTMSCPAVRAAGARQPAARRRRWSRRPTIRCVVCPASRWSASSTTWRTSWLTQRCSSCRCAGEAEHASRSSRRSPIACRSCRRRVGAAGLGADDGRHLLLADGDDAFADACVRVLSDGALRAGLADAAHELFVHHFDSRVVHEVLTAHVRSLAALIGSCRTRRRVGSVRSTAA